MEHELFGGKAWPDLSPEEREAVLDRHYVPDANDLSPAAKAVADQHDRELGEAVNAQEAAMSPEQLDFIRQRNEQLYNPDGSRKSLAAG